MNHEEVETAWKSSKHDEPDDEGEEREPDETPLESIDGAQEEEKGVNSQAAIRALHISTQ